MAKKSFKQMLRQGQKQWKKSEKEYKRDTDCYTLWHAYWQSIKQC